MAVGLVLTACEGSARKSNEAYMEAADCSGYSPTYAADVAPILNPKCVSGGCHDTQSLKHGLSLEGYQMTKYHFNLHFMLCAINHGSECHAMPQGAAKLTEAEILAITCWAKNGFSQ